VGLDGMPQAQTPFNAAHFTPPVLVKGYRACTDAVTGHYFRVSRESYELH
jgi:hypothetical protein